MEVRFIGVYSSQVLIYAYLQTPYIFGNKRIIKSGCFGRFLGVQSLQVFIYAYLQTPYIFGNKRIIKSGVWSLLGCAIIAGCYIRLSPNALHFW